MTESGLNELALVTFAVFMSITLLVTRWAAGRTRTATDFFTAGRGIGGTQNGFAIAGDYMSASSFLGVAGLMFLFGFDGFVIALAALVGFVPLLLLLAERMRNAGRFTIGDVLAHRLRERPIRGAVATATLCVAGLNLLAQLVAAGVLFQALAGVEFQVAVLLTGVLMLVYVVLGGMLATTWVQIIKAAMLLGVGGLLAVLVVAQNGFNPLEVFTSAAAESSAGSDYLGPGLYLQSWPNTVSIVLAFVVGTAAYPHILVRFFTVPDARAARRSVGAAVVVIGVFYILLSVIGYGSLAVLGPDAAVGGGANLAAPALAQELGGGVATVGGDLLLALVATVAFSTILAVVAGLVITASGTVAHDLWTNIVRRGDVDIERDEPKVARIVAVTVTGLAMAGAIFAGDGFNVTFLVTLAISVAASANFPALLLGLTWRRMTTTGAVTGIAVGLVSSIALIVLSPPVWPGPDSQGAPVELAYPALVSIPLGFLACWAGSLLGGREPRAESRFAELYVRAETGIDAEGERTSATGDGPPERYWTAVAGTREFKRLVERRKRYVAQLGGGALTWFGLFVALTCFADGFMASTVAVDGLSVAYVLGMSQIAMVWTVVWLYLRRADGEWTDLSDRVRRSAAALDRSAMSPAPTESVDRPDRQPLGV